MMQVDDQATLASSYAGSRMTSWHALDHLLALLIAMCASYLLVLANPARFRIVQPDPTKAASAENRKTQKDIYFIWKDGKAIAYGLNPYSRIHGSDMKRNDKYSTYLPGFFLLASLTVLAGVDNFYEFLPAWMGVQVALTVGIGLLLFYRWRKSTTLAVALLVSTLWIFNRWTVAVTLGGQIDIFAALFVLLSIYLHKSRPVTALLLFGVSLAIKQVAIFLLPVYLALAWHSHDSLRENLKNLAKTLGWIAIIPTAVSLPFLIWDFSGFMLSILFSATRSALTHFRTPTISGLLDLEGLVARIPMAALFLLTYVAAFQKRITLATAAFLSSAIFIGFNSVLFNQYMVWGVALSLPLLEEVALKPHPTPHSGGNASPRPQGSHS